MPPPSRPRAGPRSWVCMHGTGHGIRGFHHHSRQVDALCPRPAPHETHVTGRSGGALQPSPRLGENSRGAPAGLETGCEFICQRRAL
eukprot:12699198-Heterocapsa_arctica.AAC.1